MGAIQILNPEIINQMWRGFYSDLFAIFSPLPLLDRKWPFKIAGVLMTSAAASSTFAQ